MGLAERSHERLHRRKYKKRVTAKTVTLFVNGEIVAITTHVSV